jgi:transcriptional regulator with XRE-family HTH domain
LAHLCGCSIRTIVRAEKDGANSLEIITTLASVFGVEATQLMGIDKIEQLQQKTDEGEMYLIRLHSGKMIVESFIESLAYKIDYEIPEI